MEFGATEDMPTVRARISVSRGFSNTKNSPQNAVLLMAVGYCLALTGSIVFGESNIFASLLSRSGISGALCWVSLGACLYIFRKKLAGSGYNKADVKAPANLLFVMLLAVLLQSAGIISLGFSGDYQLPFFISSGLMIASMVIYNDLRNDRSHPFCRGRA